MDNHTLSVILPNYNHSRFIGESLEAILRQSFRPIEIIVVDDGSTDDSIMVIEEFANKEPIIKLLRNDTNQGIIFSVNRALEIASGEYVYFTAADDRVLPGFFEKSMILLAQYPHAGLCCSWPTSLEETTDVLHENRLSWSQRPRYFSPEELAEVIQGGYIAGHTSVIKRQALLEAGGYIPELKWHSDWFLVHVIAFKHGVCYIPESLAAIRVSKKTYSASGREDYKLQSQVLNHLLKLLKSTTYRWLLPYFIRGSLMSHFGDEIVRVVMSHPEHWDIETLMLIQEPLWSWNQKLKHIRDHKALEEKIQHIYENGQTAMSKGHFEDALAIFGRLTEEFPHLSRGYIFMSEAAMALGRYPLACDALTKAVKLCPNDPGLYNRLGVAQHRNGKWNLAELAFKQALALDPTNLNARMNLAEIAQNKGQYEEAGQLYMEAVKYHPRNAELWLACGRYGIDVHRWDLAQMAYRRALDIDPNLHEAQEALQVLENWNNGSGPILE